jgi:hypothetical protein
VGDIVVLLLRFSIHTRCGSHADGIGLADGRGGTFSESVEEPLVAGVAYFEAILATVARWTPVSAAIFR